jgi:hypothetical protein
MTSIIVGFSKPINRSWPFGYIFSWTIRLIEQTPYSHCFIRWHSAWLERDVVYEASGTIVGFKEGLFFDHKSKTLYEYEMACSDDVRKKIIQKAMDLSGRPYGVKQVFGILIVKIARKLGYDIKNPFSDGQATWVCSEIVAELLKELDMNINVHIDNVTPKDIQLFLEKEINS